MATLTRVRDIYEAEEEPESLSATIPTPFPREARDRLMKEGSGSSSKAREEPLIDLEPPAEEVISKDVSEERRREMLPSIASIQQSCLTTLNDLLSSSPAWTPAALTRRRSLPVLSQPAPALRTLVSDLRRADGSPMMQISSSESESDLLHELQDRVSQLSPTLGPEDALLAQTLVSLLGRFDRLAVIDRTIPRVPAGPEDALSSTSSLPWSAIGPAPTADVFDILRRQVSDLQVERLGDAGRLDKQATPVLAVESALLWGKIDEELETVLAICRQRTEDFAPARPMSYLLPPEYNPADYASNAEGELPPEYQWEGSSAHGEKPRDRERAPSMNGDLGDKMRMDLDAVTSAIDRLYVVCPQLHNQRVELKAPKKARMEQASQVQAQAGPSTARRMREDDTKDLENLLTMINKASERKLVDQSVVLEGGMHAPMERARERERKKHNNFVAALAEHSEAGRLHDQDAVLRPPRDRVRDRDHERDPDAMLSLPEFIRESLPRAVPEGIEVSSTELDTHSTVPRPKLHRAASARSRSLSAPPLAWLLNSGARSATASPAIDAKAPAASRASMSRSKRPGSSGRNVLPTVLDVSYVAEYHENLQHVLVFLTVPGVAPGVHLDANVHEAEGTGTGTFTLRFGDSSSPPLHLPVRVAPGRKDVLWLNSHYEIRLAVIPPTSPGPNSPVTSAPEAGAPLLDAPQLSALAPTSFVCASCSLPLVHGGRVRTYGDLPGEYWEELVDAWMCHADQRLHEHVQRHSSGGFWPTEGQALVGGSYVLFHASAAVKANLKVAEECKRGEEWRLVRCICGAISGRSREHTGEDGSPAIVYRLAKYAIRPVSPTSEPKLVPLSAFIVEDMVELQQAHATYRFVIFDEEEERPRLLIWLFKPSIRIGYTAPTQYIIPKSGAVHAAKILFQVIGPSAEPADLPSLLSKYPGFPQAEHLHYPIDVCRRIAGLLRESSSAYPERLRTMTGLNVGWLQRA